MPVESSISKAALFEFAVSIILGGFPVFLADLTGGLPRLEIVIKALIPAEFVIWYIAGMSVVAILVAILFKVFPPSNNPGLFWRLALEVFTELRAIYRIITGALLAFCLVWLCSDSPKNIFFGLFVFYGIAALATSIAYTLLANWVKPKATP